jgi:hypothetical protein
VFQSLFVRSGLRLIFNRFDFAIDLFPNQSRCCGGAALTITAAVFEWNIHPRVDMSANVLYTFNYPSKRLENSASMYCVNFSPLTTGPFRPSLTL